MSTYCIPQGTLVSTHGHLGGKEIHRGDIWIHIADSLCCTVEANTTVGNSTVIKINLKNTSNSRERGKG